jgi:NADH-quinone oxidoreductase subunit G
VRWQETAAASTWPAGAWQPTALSVPDAAPAAVGGGHPGHRLRLGTFRTLWAAKEVDASPSLQFLRAKPVAELSPDDAAALGIGDGDRIEVRAGDASVQAPVRLRASIPGGTVFLAAATHEEPANLLTERLVEIRRVAPTSANGHGPSALAAQVQPAVEGLAEPPASAPLDIPPTGGRA